MLLQLQSHVQCLQMCDLNVDSDTVYTGLLTMFSLHIFKSAVHKDLIMQPAKMYLVFIPVPHILTNITLKSFTFSILQKVN